MFWRFKSKQNRALDAWKRAAEKLKCRLAPARGRSLNQHIPRIFIKSEEIELVAEPRFLPFATTLISAQTGSPIPFQLRLCSKELLQSSNPPFRFEELDTLHNLGPVLTEDHEFDKLFALHTTNTDLARLWMSFETRQKILSVPKYACAFAAETVTATRLGMEDNSDQLISVIQLVLELAKGSKRMVQHWKTLANDLDGELVGERKYWKVGEGTRILLNKFGTPITIEAEFAGDPQPGSPANIQTRIQTRIDRSLEFAFHKGSDFDELNSLCHEELFGGESNKNARDFNLKLARIIQEFKPTHIGASGRLLYFIFPGPPHYVAQLEKIIEELNEFSKVLMRSSYC